jgi:general secretion pathway protein G
MVNLSPTRPNTVSSRAELAGAKSRNPHIFSQDARRACLVGRTQSGFTLMELMIVMVIIGLLAAIAVPMYMQSVRHAREAVLKEDLRTLRSAIDSYTVDKQKAPQTLEDLVQSGYIKSMPVDPFTHRSDTWVPAQDDTLMSLDQTDSGINDVHSGAPGAAADGTSYSTW